MKRFDPETLRTVATLVFAAIFSLLAYIFFNYSVTLLYMEPPRVTAGLMAGLVGFAFISAAVTVLRDWLILRAAEKIGEERKSEESQ